MARPVKKGLDYFPLDTVLDTKFELIEAEFGLKGFAVVIKLFQKIYGENGYYCEWTDEVALLFSHKLGGDSVVSEIVKACVKRGIFDKEIYEKYSVLTSKGIQARYFEAVKRRSLSDVREEYLLIPRTAVKESNDKNSVSEYSNSVNVYRNDTNKKKENNKKLDNKRYIDTNIISYKAYEKELLGGLG